MEYKNIQADDSTKTRNFVDFEKETFNIYEAVSVVARRADQIGDSIKEELSGKLQDFASYTDNLEEVFENREQIEISKYYERLPKPTLLAISEFLNDKVYYRRPNNTGVMPEFMRNQEPDEQIIEEEDDKDF